MSDENVVEKVNNVPVKDDVFYEEEIQAKQEKTAEQVEEQHPLDSWAKVKPLLPPLLPPKKMRKQQTMLGCSLVILFIAIIIIITSCAVFFGDFPSLTIKWILAGTVYFLAVLALGSIVGMLTTDPGIIRRSERTCLPLPDRVKERILTNCVDDGKECVSLNGLNNFTDGSSIYCIRCCVWRRTGQDVAIYKKRKPYHCMICECCVEQMDHHCGVFGRCIAGNGILLTIQEGRMKGNMIYFQTIIIAGMLGGFLTTVISAVSLSISVVWWAGIVLAGCLFGYFCCCGCAIWQRVRTPPYMRRQR